MNTERKDYGERERERERERVYRLFLLFAFFFMRDIENERTYPTTKCRTKMKREITFKLSQKT